MISIWHFLSRLPKDEYALAITPRSMHYTNIGIVKPFGITNVFELRDGGYVFLNEVKAWCRLPKDHSYGRSEFEEK